MITKSGQVVHQNGGAYADAIDALSNARSPLVYVGGGPRRSPGAPSTVREFVKEIDAPVLSSYNGKGVYPEDDPQFLGVTAKHLPASAKRVLDRTDVVLVLGTNFDRVTTGNWSLPMGETLIHVNLDVGDIDVAYESDVSIVADVAKASERLLDGVHETEQPTDT